jgi:hypothetical protein
MTPSTILQILGILTAFTGLVTIVLFPGSALGGIAIAVGLMVQTISLITD